VHIDTTATTWLIRTLHSFTPEILVDRSLENDKHRKKSVDIRHAGRKWLMLTVNLNLTVLVLKLANIVCQGMEEQLGMLRGHDDTGMNPCLRHPWKDSGEVHHEFSW
jgi:hypothetical protein